MATVMRPRIVLTCVVALAVAAAGCRRSPRVSDATYRQAVTAFYVSLAAMQTSQEQHARTELDRLVQLVPHEPAGWANLGLLLLRQQRVDEAVERMSKAAQLAPDSAAIQRMLALAEGRRGNLDAAVRYWRRAMELDRADIKASYALALELERAGGDQNEAEAQHLLQDVAARSNNLAAQIEYARLAARRGDRAALGRAIDMLGARAGSWPAGARERFQALRGATGGDPGATARLVIFLKNMLIRDPEYRAALEEATTPRSEIGEPLVRLVALENPAPHAAAPDAQLAVRTDPAAAAPLQDTVWAGAFWAAGDAAPAAIAAGPRGVRFASGPTLAFPGRSATPPGPDSVVAADLNYDFRTDLVLAAAGGLRIYRQDETRGFSDVTAETRLPAGVTGAAMHGVWPADVDTDGDLDLLAAQRDGGAIVLRNNGDGTFAVQTPFGNTARIRGFAWADLDGEGVPDAALLEDSGAVRVFLNLRGSRFRETAVPASFPRAAAIAAADANGDGVLDLIGVAPDGRLSRLSIPENGSTLEAGSLAQIAAVPGLAAGGTRLLIADLDNNGAGDVIVSTPSAARALLGGDGYHALGATLPGGIGAAADMDGDGRLELLNAAADGARLSRTSGSKRYRWQAIRPRAMTATGDQRINSFGIGGEVEVRTGLHAQKQPIAAPVVHFGLGEAASAEVARIAWPNGVLQSEFDLAADTAVSASQRLKGSCPWLFAWNGREMAFVTDFIWRSPLGLRINAQATADVLMTEDWVRIRGDQLAPRGGEYDLRITAELWETHFFDLVSLLAVDHPEGTEVFVDERFAVPPPRPGVIATAPVQELGAVRDDGGRDVGEIVRARDDRYLDFAGRGAYQGVMRDHYVEVELPERAPRTGPLWLVAQGWVHPTDSSVNVAISQGRHPAPTGLSMHVADAQGRFRPVRTGIGFPAGKDKTILIDLAGVFPAAGPRRLRLATNLEIFWDRLGWAIGRPDVAPQPRRLDLRSADLRFRGYSVTEQRDPSTPERPRYLLAGTAPRWRDLEGFHTRFGDVRELVTGVDDRYMIMNAGDELRVTFAEAPPPPPGMVRDFVLVGDGWVKDGDFNTTASRTVLPLATHRSPQYVPGTGRLEDDPVYQRHRADWERYHTRYVSPRSFRDALRVKTAGEEPE